MTNVPNPSTGENRLQDVLADDRAKKNDCMPCRVIGASAFIGLGVYSYVSGQNQLQEHKSALERSTSPFKLRVRQTGITGIATVLVGMGIWRLVN